MLRRRPSMTAGVEVTIDFDGAVVRLPITDESVYPELSGTDRDGYRFEIQATASIGTGPIGLALFRTRLGNEVSASTTDLAFEWITSMVRLRVHDQTGTEITGSRLTLQSQGGGTGGATGALVRLPITDEAVYPELSGADRDGYTFAISVGLNGVGASSLVRTERHNEVLAQTTTLAFEWVQHVCPLFVVDSTGAIVPGSQLLLPSPFAPNNAVGIPVTLPVTANSLYPTIEGAFANGYPIRVTPGDVAPQADTFDFELSPEGTLQPALFWIGGRGYSLVCQFNRPPVADAGPNTSILSQQQTVATLQGTASDPDSDPLTYRWFEGSVPLFGPAPVAAGGAAPLPLAAVPPFAIGDHELTLVVDDGIATTIARTMLTVGNSPPTASCSGAGTYQLGIDSVVLHASVADFDGELLTWQWTEGSRLLSYGTVQAPAGGAPVDLPTTSLTTGADATAALGSGTHVLTLIIADGVNPPLSCPLVIDVVDSAAPRLAPVSDVGVLWPPDHRMVDITIDANASDASNGPVVLSATVESSEDPAKNGSGHTIPDFTTPIIDQVNGIVRLQLRAERAGNGPGRTYTITLTARDAALNESAATLRIVAPHDRR